eukprot:Plantae.Rhodophyta-Purpureofilum_apyrenoidigerum.ctg7388.p1 GENE.Plantae.Rhodophyta-Purpureofilum_apyrenoidigerum.ctg7388~~Plantae.Rhodophyta-Purpureofilum_apyrenoidigerum.ctg7388.p1  ORF type:complete len:363 (-),score=65.09 Plantae.Rhodophyta-Purpureofilum_apyrenoidigerum.ctg7388:362-1450(-)
MAGCCCGRGAEKEESQRESDEKRPNDPEDYRGCKLHCYNIKQQKVATLTPILTPRFVVSLYYIISVLFIIVGVVLNIYSKKVVVVGPIRYDNEADCNLGENFTKTKVCDISFIIDDPMKAPFYMYYGLSNYHQNHREYVSSRSFKQLAGKSPLTLSDVSACAPALYNESTADPNDYLYPCGLTAKSQFNDTFELFKAPGLTEQDRVKWTDEGIAWELDQEVAFRPGPIPPWTEEANQRITSPDFIVWMRLATFSRFTKLYRIFQEDLEPGRYWLRITANYPVASFNGEKFFMIAETTWFGSPKKALAVLYMSLGAVLSVIATALLVRHLVKPRKLAFNNFDLVKEYLVRSIEEVEEAKGKQL